MKTISPEQSLWRGIRFALVHAVVVGLAVTLSVGFRWPILILLLLGSGLILYAGIITVDEGHEGILKLRGGRRADIRYAEGHHWILPIPFLEEVRIVNRLIQENDMSLSGITFSIPTFLPITASIGSVEWRLNDAYAATNRANQAGPSEKLVKHAIEGSLQHIAQQDFNGIIDVLAKSSETFGPLKDEVNERLHEGSIPVEVLAITKIETRCPDPRWDRFWVAYRLVEYGSRQMNTDGEAFLRSYYFERDGMLRFEQRSVNVRDILDLLKTYFSRR